MAVERDSMKKMSRRDVVKASVAAAAGVAASDKILGEMTKVSAAVRTTPRGQVPAKLKFSVCGTNHNHIQGMTDAVIRGGGELVSFYEAEPALAKMFADRYPQAKQVTSEKAILDDPTTKLVLSSIVPIHRAPLGIRVMQHGKDYMADKPGIITLEQLAEVRKVQAATRRIYSICYSERFENRATVKAGELVKAGAIGRVIQTIGMGPHRINPPDRPEWFWDPKQYGGIICDIGAHQFDQFLHFTEFDQRHDRLVAGRQREPSGPTRVPGLRRRRGARKPRHGLRPPRLVHAGGPRRCGATGA